MRSRPASARAPLTLSRCVCQINSSPSAPCWHLLVGCIFFNLALQRFVSSFRDSCRSSTHIRQQRSLSPRGYQALDLLNLGLGYSSKQRYRLDSRDDHGSFTRYNRLFKPSFTSGVKNSVLALVLDLGFLLPVFDLDVAPGFAPGVAPGFRSRWYGALAGGAYVETAIWRTFSSWWTLVTFLRWRKDSWRGLVEEGYSWRGLKKDTAGGAWWKKDTAGGASWKKDTVGGAW